MTVNVALLTSDAIVFGCDSIASSTTHLLDPFKLPRQPATPPGKFILEFGYEDVYPYVTNTWGGVTKLFPIHENGATVAAITAGAAKLNGKTMEQIAHEFTEKCRSKQKPFVNIEPIVNAFLMHVRREFDRNYEGSSVDPQFWQGPEFLVGGYGKNDAFPSLYKVVVKDRSCNPLYRIGETGAAWNGQSNAVERFLLGFDGYAKYQVRTQHEAGITAAHAEMAKKMTAIIEEIVQKTGITLPQDMTFDMSLPQANPIDFSGLRTNISYSSLPLQSAIDLVSHLVNLQSAHSTFENGIPTVGGRILIGVLTKKAKCLEVLGKPQLLHTHTGV